ncbi:hypothetical protein HN51_052521 [Arachis hypogaea]
MGQDLVYLFDVMGFLISVCDYSDVELDDGKKFKLVFIQLYSNGSYLTGNLFGDFLTKMRLALMNAVSQPPIILLQSVMVKIYEGKVVVQNVIDCSKIMINPDIPEAICFITRLDSSESYFIDSITLSNGFIVANVDDDFVNLSMNRSIKELRENDANVVKKYKVLVDVEDATGSARFVLYDRSTALLFRKKLIEVLRDFDAEHSVVYATPYPPFFDDVIGKEVVFKRLLPPTVFSPIYEDVIQNPQPHDEISSLGSRISINSYNMESIEVDMEALGDAYKVKVYVNHAGGCNALILHDGDVQHLMGQKCSEVLRDDGSFILCAIVSASNVTSIEDPVSHISGSVLPAKFVRVVNEIVCNKRLASPYRDVPRSTKQKLEDAFSRSIDETWNNNEEASSSMNI